MSKLWLNSTNPIEGVFVWVLLSCFVPGLLLKHEAQTSSGAADSHWGASVKFLFAQEFSGLFM